MGDPKRLVNETEAGILVGGEASPLKPQTMAVWRMLGKGPKFVRVGRLVRYRVGDIEAWLESRTVGGEKEK